MVTILSHGYAFYLMAVLLGIGTTMKLLVRQAYNSLTEQTEDMPHASSEWLRQLRSRYENCYRRNGAVANSKALVDKHICRYRVLGLRIGRADHMLLHISVFCMVLTMYTAFLSYRLGLSMEIITRQIFGGLMFCGGAFLLDMLIETESRREMLLVHLQDYFDNTLAFRLAADMGKGDDFGAKKAIRDDLFMRKEEEVPETRLARREDTPVLLTDITNHKRRGKSYSASTVVEVMDEKEEDTILPHAEKQTAATLEGKSLLNEAMLESLRESGKMTPQKEQIVEMIMKLVDQL